jgi:squalene synthase HpnC
LPIRLRPHVAAIYAFARTADDYADEPGRDADERLRLLQEWRRRLHDPSDDLPAFVALHHTIEQFDLPVSLFDDLLDAFTQDVLTSRYQTWDSVIDYCRRSANPVGRLVLRLSGYRDEGLDRASDAVCTALQLTNFWQDLAVDWSRGRLYVPEEIWRPMGAEPGQLDRNALDPSWVRAMAECGARTRALFDAGRSVCDGVTGRLRYELRATWIGGTRILDRLDRSGYDVFRSRPKLGTADALVIACGTLFWRKTR